MRISDWSSDVCSSDLLPLPTIDPQIVRRSAAALDRYGPDFRYGHFLQLKKLGTVLQMTGGVAAIAAAAQFKPTRERLLKIRGRGDGPRDRQSTRLNSSH